MASINSKVVYGNVETHEGGTAARISDMKTLRRSVLSCMLWENEFYEDGETISDRIVSLIQKLPASKLFEVAQLAVEARNEQHLRHVPLLIVVALATRGFPVAHILEEIIKRPDELSELLAIYWKDGKKPIAKQIKKGLAKAFNKFNEYSLAKYNQDKAIKLRDVMFLVHPKPINDAQAELWKRLVNKTLATPDTWEVELSAGKDKKEVWERLIKENKLGGLAMLRNLRNMFAVDVPVEIVRKGIAQANYSKVLPFRFIAAARFAPQCESDLEFMLFKQIKEAPVIPGKTILLVDVSGSMDTPLSEKSDMRRMDAGFGLGIILRELCENIRIFTFSNTLVEVPNRHGFALRDAMETSQPHSNTELGKAIIALQKESFDRLIVISDEQSQDSIPTVAGKAYMLNVASNKNGVGYGKWIHLDGFSEAVVQYIIAYEKEEMQS